MSEARARIEALEALEKIAASSPPDDWEPYDDLGDYNGYEGMVSEVDPSNSGDVHDHGYEMGRWSAAVEIRAALTFLRKHTEADDE